MRPCADTVRRTWAFARALLVGALGAGLALGAASAAGVPKLDERQAISDGLAVVGSVPPDFRLLDRREGPVDLSTYRGKPLLVSFIYTGCSTFCPAQTVALHQAVKGLDRMLGPHQFNVVSIGFNQPMDSPLAMRAFAAQLGVDYPNWEFLSPSHDQVSALTRAFGFSYVQTPEGFDHVVGVTVVDAEGRIHSQVWGDRLTAEALGVPLRQLLLNAPIAGTLPSLEELIDRVIILCTVYDPETGEYRYDWTLVFQIVGGLAFFLTVGVYLWHEWRAQRRARRRLPELPAGAAAH